MTLTPARIICSKIAGSLDAGPKVATILVALRDDMVLLQMWVVCDSGFKSQEFLKNLVT
jgi:hypothetical protein